MKKILSDLYATLFANKEGFSGRKLSAFYSIVVVSTYVTYKFTTPENLEWVLTIWLVFGAFCLGMVTVQQIIEFKNGTIVEPKP